ncbi:MAG: hypothetical protein GY832_10705, partial [Chloroflexi bacterium]|nr:hypothetical protein [Chloroflexota bacterium]
MKTLRSLSRASWVILLLLLCITFMIGCSAPVAMPTVTVPTVTVPTVATPTAIATVVPTAIATVVPTVVVTGTDGLSDEQIATLNSLELVDDYPLYTMYYHGDYDDTASSDTVS